ncbi:uncharacterized protein LOC118430673 [Branchiostoma floridae]|uniref:Uncharacterized protein LOC118430673 n=1 Tax=Branchiostoma floridae TaxID=7739 RepID=A0A9J7MAX6_BRAFL|nr:uncharacterized protein LOC118430673 [Branchiostoma floridae]
MEGRTMCCGLLSLRAGAFWVAIVYTVLTLLNLAYWVTYLVHLGADGMSGVGVAFTILGTIFCFLLLIGLCTYKTGLCMAWMGVAAVNLVADFVVSILLTHFVVWWPFWYEKGIEQAFPGPIYGLQRWMYLFPKWLILFLSVVFLIYGAIVITSHGKEMNTKTYKPRGNSRA